MESALQPAEPHTEVRLQIPFSREGDTCYRSLCCSEVSFLFIRGISFVLTTTFNISYPTNLYLGHRENTD